jgi:hypothetical protein
MKLDKIVGLRGICDGIAGRLIGGHAMKRVGFVLAVRGLF